MVNEYRQYLERVGKRATSIVLPKEVLERIEKVARLYSTTKSGIILLALLEFLDKAEERVKMSNTSNKIEKGEEEAKATGDYNNK